MKNIDWEKPLSDDDRKWVERFGNRAMRRQLEQNQARFVATRKAVAEESEESEEDEEPQDNYDDMKAAELKEEAKSREGFDMTGIKTRSELIEALRADDMQRVVEDQQ